MGFINIVQKILTLSQGARGLQGLVPGVSVQGLLQGVYFSSLPPSPSHMQGSPARAAGGELPFRAFPWGVDGMDPTGRGPWSGEMDPPGHGPGGRVGRTWLVVAQGVVGRTQMVVA